MNWETWINSDDLFLLVLGFWAFKSYNNPYFRALELYFFFEKFRALLKKKEKKKLIKRENIEEP